MVRTVKRAIPLCVVISLLYANGALASTSEQPLVNMLFFETDLREALSEISMQTGVNIMPDQTVSGAVTADLQDVPLEQALKILLFGGGYPSARSTTISTSLACPIRETLASVSW